MGSANLTMGVNGIDKTGAAFRSVKNRAAVTSAQIRSMVGGALGGIGAYFSFRAFKGGIDELTHLADVAEKTSTSVEELSQASTAMGILGIQNMDVDQLAKAFDNMAKATGRTGMEGFYKTIEELGKIPNLSERAQAAVKVFGRSGMEFMPLVNAAKDGTGALQGVVNIMPEISQSAANAGNAVGNSMDLAGKWVKKIWYDALGVICRNFNNQFPGGVKQATNAAMLHVEYWVHKAYRWLTRFGANSGIVFSNAVTNWVEILKAFGEYFKNIFKSIGDFFVGMWNTTWEDWKNGKWFGKGPEMLAAGLEKAAEKVGKKLAPMLGFGDLIEGDDSDLDEKLQKKLEANEKLEELLKESKKLQKDLGTGSSGGGLLSSRSPSIRNDLILGGSNAATRLQLLGPQFQNEAKKQTSILEKIARNTEKTADNTEAENEERFDTVTP